MNVNKEAGVDCGLELSPEEMERINAMSKKKLEPGEVYAFAVRQRDRPGQRAVPGRYPGGAGPPVCGQERSV